MGAHFNECSAPFKLFRTKNQTSVGVSYNFQTIQTVVTSLNTNFNCLRRKMTKIRLSQQLMAYNTAI